MSSEPHPMAVTIARIMLLVVGASIVAIGSGAYFSGVAAPAWVWIMTFSFGLTLLMSAFFDSASEVIASIIIFFHP